MLREERLKAVEHMEALDNLVNEFEEYEEQLKSNKRHDSDIAKEIVKTLVLNSWRLWQEVPLQSTWISWGPQRNRKRNH